MCVLSWLCVCHMWDSLQVETWVVKVKAALNSCKSYVWPPICELSLQRPHLLACALHVCVCILYVFCRSGVINENLQDVESTDVIFVTWAKDHTCPGQGWIQRTSHDTGHSAALPVMDGHTHTDRSGSHNHAVMLPWDGSHTPHTHSALKRGRSLDRQKHKIKPNYASDCVWVTSQFLLFLPPHLFSADGMQKSEINVIILILMIHSVFCTTILYLK